MGAFRLARSAAYQNDQSGMFLRLPRERQEVITVAADENPSPSKHRQRLLHRVR